MLTRRHLLKTIVIAAGSVSAAGMVTGCTEKDDQALPPPRARDLVFPQSIASGDPRATSVVLWTRVSDPEQGNISLSVRLDVASDPDFTNLVVSRRVSADADFDHCLKVRVTGLDPDRFYYYRFVYDRTRSRVGRTRTAPDVTSNIDIRFGVVAGQDYVGRYFNSYLHILENDDFGNATNIDTDLNFMVFLGDYVFETTGDPQFQIISEQRALTFTDADAALRVGTTESGFNAANSLDNYRQLYRTARQDPLLQRMHERYPFICTWNDHEFSDDGWSENGNYSDGANNEASAQRRRNAERAFLEYMPVDHRSVGGAIQGGEGGIPVTMSDLFPETQIYRDFRFGSNLQLFMTDVRSYRPDHPVPENAFPGKVVIAEAELSAFIENRGGTFSDVRGNYSPYVDISLEENADRRQALRLRLVSDYSDALTARGIDPATRTTDIQQWVDGALEDNVAISVINNLLDENLQVAVTDATPRGLAYITMFKSELLSEVGSRYFLVKPVYEVYTEWQINQPDDRLPVKKKLLGNDQYQWLTEGILASTTAYKVVMSPVSFSPMLLDLSEPGLAIPDFFFEAVPEEFRQAYTLNADGWEGFPRQRRDLINAFDQSQVVTFSGNAQAVLVSVQGTNEKAIDFSIPPLASYTARDMVRSLAAKVNDSLVTAVDNIDLNSALRNSNNNGNHGSGVVEYVATDVQGITVVTVSPTRLQVDMFGVNATRPDPEGGGEPIRNDGVSAYDQPADYLSRELRKRFRVNASGILSTLF